MLGLKSDCRVWGKTGKQEYHEAMNLLNVCESVDAFYRNLVARYREIVKTPSRFYVRRGAGRHLTQNICDDRFPSLIEYIYGIAYSADQLNHSRR
jgi:hypothetical protein